MLIILDDVLDDINREAVRSYFTSDEAPKKISWADGSVTSLIAYGSPLSKILSTVQQYVDISEMVGCEYWYHHNTRPNWHVDKDENLYKQTGAVDYPMYSIVYYADVDCIGGNFLTDTVSVAPKTNRMLIFSKATTHSVAPFSGTRLSIAVNPWSHKPME